MESTDIKRTEAELQAEINRLRQRLAELETEKKATPSESSLPWLDYLKSLAKTIPHGILFESPQRTVLLANQAFCDLFGVPSPEAIEHADCVAVAEASKSLFENPTAFINDIEMTVAAREPVSAHILRLADGRSLSRGYTPINSDDEFVGHLWVYRDVTERLAQMQKVREDERRHREFSSLVRLMADNIPDMIWAKDMENRYIFANKALCENLLNARDTREPIGKTDLFFEARERAAHPENPDWHTFGRTCADSDAKVMRSKRPLRFEECGNVRGKRLCLDVHKAPIFNDAGEMIGTVGVGRDVTREREIERNLRQTQELFRRVVEESNEGICITDESGVIIVWNEAQAQITGRCAEDALGKSAADVQFEILPPAAQTPEARRRVMARLAQVLKTGEHPALYKIRRFTVAQPGEKRDKVVEEATFTIKTEKGYKLVSLNRDVTEQVALEQRMSLLSGAVESADENIVITDHDGVIEYVNPTFERLTGYTLAEVVGKTPRVLKSGEHSRRFYEKLWDTILAGKVYRGVFINRKKNGEHYAEEKIITPIFDQCGEITHFVSTGRDITDRLAMEKALQQSQARYRQATDAGNVGIFEWDVQTGEMYIDPHLKAILGYKDDEIRNHIDAWLDIVHPDDVANFMKRMPLFLTTDEPVYETQYRVYHKDGSIRWLLMRSSGMKNEAGDVVRMVGTYTDITELVEARLQAETLREVTLALVSHTDVDAILHEVFVQAERLLRYTSANIALIEGDHLKVVASTGYEQYDCEAFINRLEQPINEYPITYTPLRTKKPIVIPDVRAEPSWHVFEPTAWIHGYIGLPLIVHDTVLGLLRFDFDTPNAISADAAERLQPLAIATAIAIDHAKLLAQTQKRAEQLALVHTVGGQVNRLLSINDILEITATLVHRTLNYDVVQVVVVDADNGVLRFLHRAGLPPQRKQRKTQSITQGILGRAVRTRKTQWVNDTAADPDYLVCSVDARSEISVPIFVGDEIFGVLDVNARPAHAFDASDVLALEALAKQLGIILENASLFRQTKQDAETKTILLQEVNHRVKNNLAAIIGLLYIEKRQHNIASPADFKMVMDDLINRVRGMATAHQLLSASEWQPVSLFELVKQTIKNVTCSMPAAEFVRVHISPTPLKVVAAQAPNIALIINELATNTIKYGLKGVAEPMIDVSISRDGDDIIVRFKDNGPGFDEAVIRMEAHNIGLDLVKNMAENALMGSFALENDDGAVTILRFPLRTHL